MAVRVLLADAHELVRAGVAMLLSAEPDIEVVGGAGDAQRAVELARSLLPDVVLLDAALDAVTVTAHITADARCPGGITADAGRTGGVIVLTAQDAGETIQAALRAGASGLLLKHAAPRELVAAVRAVGRGEAWLDSRVTRGLLAELITRPRPGLSRPAGLAELTPREREVLALVAEGLTNAEIAGRLVVTEATVKTHVSRVLMKLGLRDRTQAVVVAYETGLVRAMVRT